MSTTTDTMFVSDDLRYYVSSSACKIWSATTNPEHKEFCAGYIYPSLMWSKSGLEGFHKFLSENGHHEMAEQLRVKLTKLYEEEKQIPPASKKRTIIYGM